MEFIIVSKKGGNGKGMSREEAGTGIYATYVDNVDVSRVKLRPVVLFDRTALERTATLKGRFSCSPVYLGTSTTTFLFHFEARCTGDNGYSSSKSVEGSPVEIGRAHV